MKEKKKEIKNIYPLVPMQVGMLFHALKDSKENAYFRQVIFDIEGEVDKTILEKSLNKLVERYDVFRTIFVYDKVEKPLRVVLKEQEIKLVFHDLASLSAKEQEVFLKDFLQADRDNLFDLSKDMLVRVALFKIDEKAYKMLWSFHHILMDGWCTGILFKDLFIYYREMKKNLIPHLNPVEPYVKYMKWVENRDKEKSKQYWCEYLEGYEEQAGLPLEQSSKVYEQTEHDFVINEALTQKMSDLAKKNCVTMNTLFQTAWGVLLQIYNDTNDVVFGSVVSGRPSEVPGIDQVVGLFINTIPVRIEGQKEMTFNSLMQKVQKETLKSEEESYFPLYEILEYTPLKQELFNHLIAFENYPIAKGSPLFSEDNGEDFKITDFEMYQKTNYNFNIIVMPEKVMKIKFIYNAQAFDVDLMKQIERHLIRVLEIVTTQEDIKLGEINILSEEEKNQQLYVFNDSSANYPKEKMIHQIFEEVVEKYPERIAISFKGQKVTYSELNKRANQLAHFLRNKGVKNEQIVGLYVERSVEMIVGILAILKAGGAYLPIDPIYPKSRVEYTLKDSGTTMLLTQKSVSKEIDFSQEIIYLDDMQSYLQDDSNLDLNMKPSQLAYIIYTSGTTGNPKGAMIEHRNVIRLMHNDKMQFDFNEQDVWTMFHSVCFDFSVWEMYGALLYGGKLVIVPKEVTIDTEKFVQLVNEERVTVLNQTPQAFYNYIEAEEVLGYQQTSIRYIVFGGEALQPIKLKKWHAKYPQVHLINMYGITETTVHVTYKEITDEEINHNISNIGKPIPTLKTYVLDNELKLQPIGVVGEMCVAGDGVGRGYLNRVELTAEKFVSNPYIKGERMYLSGDLVKLLPNGEMQYVGRKDHQVKIRGFRVELGEIQHKLLTYPEIKEAIVTCYEEALDSKFLCAYIVGNIDITDLKTKMEKDLPHYMIPSFFMQLDKLPLTRNGKVDRKALPKPTINKTNNYVAPITEDEKVLVQIYSTVCNVNAEKVGIEDSFFDLGGNSIRAIRLLGLVNKQFKCKLQLNTLYRHATIKALLQCIRNPKSSDEDIYEEQAIKEITELKQHLLQEKGSLAVDLGRLEDFYPISDIQLGMIFHSMNTTEIGVYHDQTSYLLEDDRFDKVLFEKAMVQMAQKHTILRTTFDIEDYSIPIQMVHYSLPLDIEYIDTTNQNPQDVINSHLEEDRAKAFDIRNKPLWRIKVFFMSDKVCINLICHHAILDGWSVANLMVELVEIYKALKDGIYKKVVPLKVSYKKYIINQMAAKKDKKCLDYWKQEFEAYKRFDFPKKLSIENKSDVENEVYIKYFSDDMIDELKEVAKRLRVDLKTICLSAYLYMLYVIGYEDEVVAGVVEHNRPECEDGDKVLGCFLNTLPIKLQVEKNMTWEKVINSVAQKMKDIKMYGKVSFFEITKVLGESSNESNPMFDTFFNFVDFHVYEEYEETMLKEVGYTGSYESNNALLYFTVSMTKGYMGIKVIYKSSMLEKEQVIKWTTYYENIMKQFINHLQEPAQKQRVLEVREKEDLLEKFNATEVKFDESQTLKDLLEKQVKQTPDKIAVVFKDQSMTYEAFNKYVNKLARILKSKGIGRNAIVGVMVNRSIEMLACMWATLKLGAAYLPIDPHFPKERITYMLTHCKANLLITQSSISIDESVMTEKINLEDLSYEDVLEDDFETVGSAEDLAYIIYTSGSTGKPKGVMLENRTVVNFIEGMKERLYLTSEQTIAALTTISFDIFVVEALLPLTIGMKIVIADEEEQKDPKLLTQLIEDYKINLLQMTPSRLKLMLVEEKAKESLKNVSEILIGGENWSLELLNEIRNLTNARIYNMYGPTETTVWSTVKELTHEKHMTVGKPIANTQIYITNKNRDLQPIGSIGELCIAGKCLARGYLKEEKLTQEKFIDNPFKFGEKMYCTGDMVRWLENGEIEFIGRIDDQVKIRGFRIELGEIESRMMQYAGIKQAVVVAKEDSYGNKFLCAYYLEDMAVDKSLLKEHLAECLPEYMIPSYIVSLKEFPMTANGKINRKLLPSPNVEEMVEETFEEPVSTTEKRLLEIWQEVLQLKNIGTQSTFFEIGGDSLKAAILKSKIAKAFQVDVSIKYIFKYTTIKSLAKYIEEQEISQKQAILPTLKQEYYPITSAQRVIYLAEKFSKGKQRYNLPGAMYIEGKLDISWLTEVFRKIINRQEVYRTGFYMVGGEVKQKIIEDVAFDIELIEDANTSIEQLMNEFVKPFDLEKPPLLRVKIVQIDKEKYYMLFDVHHIISDGFSAQILINEFKTLYDKGNLPELVLQYKDYAVWEEKEFRNSKIFEEKKKYWCEVLKGEIPKLSLPIDYEKAEESIGQGASVRCTLENEFTKEIYEFAKKNEFSVFEFLLVAFEIVLSAISGQQDIIVGVPTLGRKNPDVQDMIGMFVNTLPVRLNITQSGDTTTCIKSMAKQLEDMLEHQDYPVYELTQTLNIQKDRKELYDVIFVQQNIVDTKIRTKDLELTNIILDDHIALVDLQLKVLEENNSLCFVMVYNKTLFKEQTAEKMLNKYQNVLKEIIQGKTLEEIIANCNDKQRRRKALREIQFNI